MLRRQPRALCGFARREPRPRALPVRARAGASWRATRRAVRRRARSIRRTASGLADAALAQLAAARLVAPAGWVAVEHHVDDAPGRGVRTPAVDRGAALWEDGRGVVLELAHGGAGGGVVKRKAVYAGSFDPITKGHLDIVRRALGVFDEVVVAVAHNPAKDTRAVHRRRARRDDPRGAGRRRRPGDGRRASPACWSTTATASRRTAIIRGLRAVSDFEYEFQMAMMNRHLNARVETFFMTASEAYFYTASRLVKEVASLGGDVSALVPPVVHRALVEKFGPQASREPTRRAAPVC